MQITECNRRIIQFLDELHFSSIGYANQIIFTETHNQGFSAEMEMHIYIKLNVIIIRERENQMTDERNSLGYLMAIQI